MATVQQLFQLFIISILPAYILTGVVRSVCHLEHHDDDAMMLMKFRRVLNRETRQWMVDHQCKVRRSHNQTDQSGQFERWIDVTLCCSNAGLNLVYARLCQSRCRNPNLSGCRRVINVTSSPVFWDFRNSYRDGRNVILKLPIACSCKLNRGIPSTCSA